MVIKELYKLKQENNFEAFYKKVLAFIPSLNKFATLKLKFAENEGFIDKGFYNVNDILDEVYLEVFNSISKKTDTKKLRKMLFFSTLKTINEKAAKEEELKTTIRIGNILKEELDLLDENYTVDGDGDFILDEELDDISYTQKSFRPSHFILDQPIESQLTGKLNLDTILYSDTERGLLGGIYKALPSKSKMIIDLYVFGDQSIPEVSEILLIDEETIRKVIAKVTEKLRSV